MGGTGRQEVEGFGLRKRRGAVKGKSPGRPRVTGWMWTLVIHPSIIHHPPPTTHPSTHPSFCFLRWLQSRGWAWSTTQLWRRGGLWVTGGGGFLD